MFGFKKPAAPPPPDPVSPAVWPDPDCAPLGPREAQISALAKTWMVLLRGASIATIAVGVPIAIHRADTLDRLAREGQVVEATVDLVRESKGKSRAHDAHMEFELSNQRVGFWQYLGARRYPEVFVGQTFPVTAIPSDPQVYRFGTVASQDVFDAQFAGSAIVAILAFVLGGGALITRLVAQRDRKILATWPASIAQVLSIKSQSAGKSGTTYTLRYRTPLATGRFREGTYVITQGTDLAVRTGQFFTFFEDPSQPSAIRPLFTFSFAELVKPPLESDAKLQ